MPPRTTLENLPPWLILMGSLAAIGPLAIDMYLPSFPAIAADLGVAQGLVEQTLATYLLGLALAQLCYGPLADRYGRKIPLLGGLALFVVASLGCATAATIDQLALWRIVQAFGGAAGMVIPRAVIRDHLETRDAAKALSLLMLVMGVMPILAPLLGAQALLLGSWRTIFHIMAAVGILQWVAVATSMRESLDPAHVAALTPRIVASTYRDLLRHKAFMGYALAGGFGSAGLFAYISGSPRVFILLYGVEPQYFGLLFGLNAASLIVASQIGARLLNRHTPAALLKRSLRAMALAALAALLLTLADLINLSLLMLCLMGFMASLGFVGPNAAALALSEQGRRLGIASALMGGLQMLCGALSGLAISAWHTETPLPLAGILALCAALAWLSGRFAMRAA
ncbi:multidrug effflux MFS transporter [Castellaniella sp. S9]|uniref:multidrug effflux MFS transporter n=1 Tax=Castellaniella sp. S9 TaxID=2993652 RepID=UPI0022B4A17C|nr:multidrug effflux MFS transporter [Castellaniella sp. S9]